MTKQRVMDVIQIAYDACRALGVAQPRIAVAGLNPHASEGGLFGNEEATAIEPAINEMRARGMDVSDRWPRLVFLHEPGAYDILIVWRCCAIRGIPMKLLAFDSGVNVSLGLPVIRTSVDHGTAFDIAGRGLPGKRACWPQSTSRSRWSERGTRAAHRLHHGRSSLPTI
ncbi:MAG: 4-hydroxythreonine-4-phosphate dehydrogenase PdxA [Thermomicrobiales bacterium]